MAHKMTAKHTTILARNLTDETTDYWLRMAALSQYNPLHYIFPTAQQQAEIIFLSL
jgi:hypothetical protein